MARGRKHDPSAYWNRRLEQAWDLQGVGLKGSSLAYNRWLYRVRARVFQRAVRGLGVHVRGGKVLDVGPGIGFYIERWLDLGASVTGIDIAESAVRRLRLRFPSAEIVSGDISDPDLALPNGFDIVDAFDVLFHIVDDESYRAALANVHASLRDGGYFVFTESAARRHRQPMKHYVRRSRAEVEDALFEAGFEIVSCRPAFVLMLNPFDGTSLHRRAWRRLKPLMANELTGGLIGALLYGPELLLTRLKRTGPTTKLFVCRKPAVPAS